MTTYVVVLFPGTDQELPVAYFPSFLKAVSFKEKQSFPADVMRVLPNGNLTTEF